MTKLFEYQSKELIKKEGVKIPRSDVAVSGEEAEKIASDLGGAVVVKAQAWITGRAGVGAIQFAGTPADAKKHAENMLGMVLNKHQVEKVLIEEKLDVETEYYAGITINDRLRRPVLIFSSVGGTGIEDLATKYPDKIANYPIQIGRGLKEYEVRNVIRKTGVPSKHLLRVADMIIRLYNTARKCEARSAEINPIGVTASGDVYALDCRIVVDDNAVFRHPELGIEVAREFDHPPTRLEKIAYKVEDKDYRGTFYFIQLENNPQGEGYIAFHGGGGGGSIMGMDALMRHGFKLLNFCDTSGNPSASKVYRAAKIILMQDNIEGYFATGSGVASQEQYHTARGLVKAFREENLSVPAVLRVGGNSEEEAIRIIHEYTRDLPGKVEAYGRDTSVDFCVERLKKLIKENKEKKVEVV